MTVDVVRVGPPLICTYTQSGLLLSRCLFAAMRDPMLYNGSKLRFVECADNAFFIVDLGLYFSVHFVNLTTIIVNYPYYQSAIYHMVV